jgi:flagellar biosynthesis/type III secretory pathway chaperone
MSNDRRYTREETLVSNSSVTRHETTVNMTNPTPQSCMGNNQFNGFIIEAQDAELNADTAAFLRYAADLNNDVVVTGSSDYSKISILRNAILELRSHYFNPNSGLSVQGEKRDELDRRFLLIEHEFDGLLRRRIEYSTKDYQGGSRNLDFTGLLNEKENQIVQLYKRIDNLEERLRKANAKEGDL